MSSSARRDARVGTDDFDWSWTQDESDWVPPPVDPTKVSAARIYDYLLDGKDHFEVDRLAAEQLLQVAPYAKVMAKANRAFLHRAVRYMVDQCGIRQIIDFGTGIPTSPNVHEVAREVSPDVRVLSLDNDPVVTAHNRAVLASEPGAVTLLRDLREPDGVLKDPLVRTLIDFDEPVGLLFVAVLHFVSIDQAPAVLACYRDAVPPGSCLALSAVCRDRSDEQALRIGEAMYENSEVRLYARSTAQIEQLFEGFRLPEPLAGVVDWRPGPGEPPEQIDMAISGLCPISGLCGVGIKT